jgi:hypothetical protein
LKNYFFKQSYRYGHQSQTMNMFSLSLVGWFRLILPVHMFIVAILVHYIKRVCLRCVYDICFMIKQNYTHVLIDFSRLFCARVPAGKRKSTTSGLSPKPVRLSNKYRVLSFFFYVISLFAVLVYSSVVVEEVRIFFFA